MEKLLGDDFEVGNYTKVDVLRLETWVKAQIERGITHVHFEADLSREYPDRLSIIALMPMLITKDDELK